MKPGSKPPVSRAHNRATRQDVATPANNVAFARLARQAKAAKRRSPLPTPPQDNGPSGGVPAS